VLSFNRRFVLAGAADPVAPIVVRVDGAVLGVGQWAYDAQRTTVELVDAPHPGAVVEVTYIPACD